MTKQVQICIKPNDDDDRPLAEISVCIDGKMIDSAWIGGEPEDNSYTRDYAWIPTMIKNIAEQLGADAKIVEIDQTILDDIKRMSHYEMARLWRFTPSDIPYFDDRLPYFEIFEKRFKELGGMTYEISKQIEEGK